MYTQFIRLSIHVRITVKAQDLLSLFVFIHTSFLTVSSSPILAALSSCLLH